MAKKPVKYYVVDAFTDSAFKGNPAAICLLDEERDEEWLQAVAAEFNISETCYLTRIAAPDELSGHDSLVPRFRLRWFTPVSEVELCGHATLAAAYVLFAFNLVDCGVVEFLTLSGVLTAKRVPETKVTDACHSSNGDVQQCSFLIELNFPILPTSESDYAEVSTISRSLNGASVIEIRKTAGGDLLVVLPSADLVLEVQPQLDQILKFPIQRGVIITARAPPESGFDFFSRFFCPKLGINEDPVCGSAHCALAHYWGEKLGRCDFIAYQASSRSGVLKLHIDKKSQRVFLQGKATVIMEGFLLV